MYQRVGAKAFKKDLSNTLKLTQALGRPHLRFPAVHVAGTNGKGSTCAMLASVLTAAGYKVGLYTSPHLKDFRERIRINGNCIEQSEVVDFVLHNKELIEDIQPSFFEITVAMAFEHFAKHEVDIAIIETGLGGRLDSTNIIHPLVSVITNIGMDHMDMLGNDLVSIAREKAGIIKSGKPVVVSGTQPEVLPVFREKAASVQAPLFESAQRVKFSNYQRQDAFFKVDVHQHGRPWMKELVCSLGAQYQLHNLRACIQTLWLLEEEGFSCSAESVRTGLGNIARLTGFRGRWDVLAKDPWIIADGAHNADGLMALFNQVNKLDYEQIHLVMGMVVDKKTQQLLRYFPKEGIYYFCRPDVPRGLDAQVLQEHARELDLNGEQHDSVKEALAQAMIKAGEKDLILICGSLFVVAETPFEQFEKQV
jgi:dihydrofolate synthase/folylpolyglutamate synthase